MTAERHAGGSAGVVAARPARDAHLLWDRFAAQPAMGGWCVR